MTTIAIRSPFRPLAGAWNLVRRLAGGAGPGRDDRRRERHLLEHPRTGESVRNALLLRQLAEERAANQALGAEVERLNRRVPLVCDPTWSDL